MKILKRILFVIIGLLLVLVAVLYFYKDTLIRKIVEKVNQDYNVEITYNNVGLGLLKDFPNATLSVTNLLVVTEEPFKNDTLVYAKNTEIAINIKDVFKKNVDKIKVKNIRINQAKVNLFVNADGKANNDVHLVNPIPNVAESNTKATTNSQDFTFKIANYQIENSDLLFEDKQQNFTVKILGFNHKGTGDFSTAVSNLNTNTIIDEITVKYGKINYLYQAKIVLDAIIKMDLNTMKFTLTENDLHLNDLHLKLNGFVQHNTNNEIIDFRFNAPNTNFKSVLSLIPNAYSANFKDVKASGIANISGFVNGKFSDTEMPKYQIAITTQNASFKYPDLPKSVRQITFNGNFANESQQHKPFVQIDKLKFAIDQDVFETTGVISNIVQNPTVDASFKGKLNLDNFYKAYPIKMDNKITGILVADFHTNLDMKSVENNNYKDIKTNGTASLQDFSYSDKEMKNPVLVDNASIKFNTNTINLTNFKAKTGKSDIQATGTVDNLYAFVFDDKKLKGNFVASSNNFEVSDFLVNENDTSKSKTTSTSTTSENLKIPDFLDITTKINAKRVVYNNLVLEDVSSLMKIKDQKAILQNTKTKMMQGQASFNGIVDTKKTPAEFNFDLDLNKFDIASSFSEITTFQKLAPVANAINGKYNSDFSISGKLKPDFTPDLYSLSGKILAQLFVKEINENNNPLFTSLVSKLKFIDLKKIDFNKLKASVQFKDGKVHVNPFDIKYKDITMHISGSHSFDKSLLYHINMNLPAKYLGKEAQNMLSKLTNIDKDTIKIPLYTLINGTFDKPKVSPNFEKAIKELAVKVVKYQKQQLLNQATNQVNNVVEEVLQNTNVNSIIPNKDSTKNNPKNVIKEGVQNLLGNMFKKKKKDTTK